MIQQLEYLIKIISNPLFLPQSHREAPRAPCSAGLTKINAVLQIIKKGKKITSLWTGGKKGQNHFRTFNKNTKGKKNPQKKFMKPEKPATTSDCALICFDYAFKRCKEAAPDDSRCKKGTSLYSVCCGPYFMVDHAWPWPECCLS